MRWYWEFQAFSEVTWASRNKGPARRIKVEVQLCPSVRMWFTSMDTKPGNDLDIRNKPRTFRKRDWCAARAFRPRCNVPALRKCPRPVLYETRELLRQKPASCIHVRQHANRPHITRQLSPSVGYSCSDRREQNAGPLLRTEESAVLEIIVLHIRRSLQRKCSAPGCVPANR